MVYLIAIGAVLYFLITYCVHKFFKWKANRALKAFSKEFGLFYADQNGQIGEQADAIVAMARRHRFVLDRQSRNDYTFVYGVRDEKVEGPFLLALILAPSFLAELLFFPMLLFSRRVKFEISIENS